MLTMGVVARLAVELSATGVAETAAKVRSVGTAAEESRAKVGLLKGLMGSFLVQQLAFAAISKAISWVSTNVQDAIAKTEAWDNAVAQLNAVIKSTGAAAGYTAQQAIDLANAMMTTTNYTDAQVLSAENLVLTFTGISSKAVPETTRALLDMATALKEDTKSAAIQLGKALQDPILGVTALRRVGVNFSKDNQAMLKQWVETGQTARAQTYILKEIEREFGGSGAAATTFAGRLFLVGHEFDKIKEALVNSVEPAFERFVEQVLPSIGLIGDALPGALARASAFFQQYLKQPLLDIKDIIGAVFGALGTLVGAFIGTATSGNTLGETSKSLHLILQDIAKTITQDLTPALLRVGIAAGIVAKAFATIGAWITQNKTAIQFIAVLVGVVLADAFSAWAIAIVESTVAMLANPIGLIIAGIYLLIAGIVMLVIHWQQVVQALGWVKDRMGELAGAIGEFIGGVLGAVGDFTDKLIDLYTWPYRVLWDHIGPFVKGFTKVIINFFGNLIGILLRAGQLVLAVLTWPWRLFIAILVGVGPIVLGALGRFFGMLLGKLGDFGAMIFNLVKGPIGGLLGAFGWIKDKLGDLAGVIGGFIGGAIKLLGDAWKGLGDIVGNIWGAISGDIKTGMNVVIGLINTFIDALDKIQIHIPSFKIGAVETPGLDWGGIGIPEIPYLAQGGTVGRGGSAIMGDRGPELLSVDSGGVAHVMPILPGAQDLSAPQVAAGEVHVHMHVPAGAYVSPQQLVASTQRALMLQRGRLRFGR